MSDAGDVRTGAMGIVDAFTTDPFAGTTVHVVADAGGLEADEMEGLAREVGATDAAFVRAAGADDATHEVRYVGPNPVAALRGHATVAAGAHLHREGVVDPGSHAVETEVGTLDVEVTADGVVWVAGGVPSVETVAVDYDRVGEALGVDPAALRDVGADLSAAVASIGRRLLVVPVNFLERLGEADPDDDAVAALAERHDAAGVFAFTFDALAADSTLHARCFAPGLGASEAPPSGVASGAAGAYLHAVGAFDDQPEELRVECGHFVDRPGIVRVRVETGAGRAGGVESVAVGGRAVTVVEGRAILPAGDEDDDIVVA